MYDKQIAKLEAARTKCTDPDIVAGYDLELEMLRGRQRVALIREAQRYYNTPGPMVRAFIAAQERQA